ncbi:MAG: YwaF family protein [Clostridia bacterium]|nr:YwaF family protein [Clostridia bacterium]
MFFSKPGEYAPCKMFSSGHFILLSITIIAVIVAVCLTKNMNKDKVKNLIKKLTLFLWILEIIKIIFNLAIGNSSNPNNYIPLYYCSLILYAGLLSGFSEGKLKMIGDVFIATGGIIGGLFFLFCPNTSLPTYPMFHYISIQSFVFHGIMLYLGVLVNITNYIDLKISDIKYYASLVSIISFISYFVNKILGTNFMFISDNFPNTPVEIVYNLTGKFFTLVMILIQVVGPFYVIYFIRYKLFKMANFNKTIKEQ